MTKIFYLNIQTILYPKLISKLMFIKNENVKILVLNGISNHMPNIIKLINY